MSRDRCLRSSPPCCALGSAPRIVGKAGPENRPRSRCHRETDAKFSVLFQRGHFRTGAAPAPRSREQEPVVLKPSFHTSRCVIAFFMIIILYNYYKTAWCMICQACGIEKLGQVYAMSQAFRLKQSIEDAVIAGEFLPGDRLDEASLAERFGGSRTPILAGLLQLGAEGFLDVGPGRAA